MESFSRPPPARGGPCADPEASWGHRKNNLLRSEDELFYGYYLSAGIMMREENGPAVPELARRATLSSCRHDPVRALVPVLTAMPAAGHPARRHPRRLRLRPPRRRTPGRSRCAPPAPSSSRTCTRTTAAPKAPTTAPSSPTATSTARAPRARCWNSGRSPATPPGNRPPPTTPAPPNSPGYKLGRLTRDDPDGYHRVAVPRRHGQDPLPAPARIDDPGPGPARRSSSPRSTRQPAAPSRPSPSRPRSPPRPRRNTTTPPPRTAAPTPAAPAPNAASPPPRTPPPTTSAAAGAASWA